MSSDKNKVLAFMIVSIIMELFRIYNYLRHVRYVRMLPPFSAAYAQPLYFKRSIILW